MSIPTEQIGTQLTKDLKALYDALKLRIPEPEKVRLPHVEIEPIVRPTCLTYVVLDQARAAKLPIARLYYLEETEQLKPRVERTFTESNMIGKWKNSNCAKKFAKQYANLRGKATVD